MTFGIFEEIERLIECIPLESSSSNTVFDKNNVRLARGVSLDSRFRFHDVDGVAVRLGIIDMSNGITTVSFRDIIRLLNKFLKNATIEELVSRKRYKHLQSTRGGAGLPLKSLLFDFCLVTLEEKQGIITNNNLIDAKLYLAHSLHLLGIHSRLNLILSIIANDPLLRKDEDVRRFLTLIAMMAEPDNIDPYFDPNLDYYNNRYSIYLKEIQKLTLSVPMKTYQS